jgi:hypothetical protein
MPEPLRIVGANPAARDLHWTKSPDEARESRDLSDRDFRVLMAVIGLSRGRGRTTATDRQIGRAAGGKCRATVQTSLRALIAAGWLERTADPDRPDLRTLHQTFGLKGPIQKPGHPVQDSGQGGPVQKPGHPPVQDPGHPRPGSQTGAPKILGAGAHGPGPSSRGSSEPPQSPQNPGPTSVGPQEGPPTRPDPEPERPPEADELALLRSWLADPAHPYRHYAWKELSRHGLAEGVPEPPRPRLRRGKGPGAIFGGEPRGPAGGSTLPDSSNSTTPPAD